MSQGFDYTLYSSGPSPLLLFWIRVAGIVDEGKIGSQSLSFFPEIRFYRQKWGSIGRRSEAYRWKKRNINKRRSCESLIRFCSCHNWPPPSPPYARRLLLPLCPFIFFLLLYISFHWHSNPPCASSPTSFPAAVYLPCLLHFASNRAN